MNPKYNNLEIKKTSVLQRLHRTSLAFLRQMHAKELKL
jgi:hypothetical protein